MKVTLSPHLSETGPSVTHYAVHWRTADQDFHSSHQALSSETADLTDTVGKPAWKTVAAKGPPEAPTNVTAVGGRNSLLVSWSLPEGGAIHGAFVIQWRTGATCEPGNEVGVWRPWVGP